MSVFTDRRPWRQIGGLRNYLGQVGWSLWWRIELRRRSRGGRDRSPPPYGRRRALTPPPCPGSGRGRSVP